MAADFTTYQDRVTSALVNVTRSAAGISSFDLSFHRSLSDTASKSLDAQSAHLLRLTSKLLKAATKETNIKAPVVQDKDGVDDNWRKIVDVVDDLLEKADANLDEFSGVIKRLSPTQAATPERAMTPRMVNSTTYSATSKPQLQFARKVDNYETGPWKPLLQTKPHAVVPIQESIGSEETGYKHPYAHEIEHFQYPPSVYQEALPISFTRPELTEPVWVDTEEAVLEMLEELKNAAEIAIDLEHNDKNSYVGMVSLMQISTRTKDWIVDTLKPWRENLQVLNEVFADPSIVKLFHGSTSDMIWLQRDLGLYIVGLFDTFHAASALNYQGKGLAFLLQKFANFHAQKQYQLADWRVRPLPQELLDYARSDTHYLLYIYDNMRNELVRASTPDNNLIDYVLEHSRKESLQVYERHQYDRDNGLGPGGFLSLLLTRTARSLDKQQFGVFRTLHEWRDQKAREFDEGVHSIMTNNYLWGCAEAKPEIRGQLFNNRTLGRASYYVSNYSQQVLDAIKRGKREGAQGPTVQEIIERNADKLSHFRKFQHTNPQAKPQEVQQSVAATMQQLVQSGELRNGASPASVDTTEPVALRGTTSQLWGLMQLAMAQPVLNQEAAQQALESIMPVQSLIGDPSSTSANAEMNEVSTSDTTPLPSTNSDVRIVSEPDIDVPFVLRNLKKKRPVDELEAEDDHVSTGPNDNRENKFEVTDEGDILTQQQARKAFKKARKEAGRALRDAEAAGASADELKPFDYANAPSILKPAPKAPEPLRTYKDSRPDKSFNPFAKALDAGTGGAKRNKFGKEMAGKSHTFKS